MQRITNFVKETVPAVLPASRLEDATGKPGTAQSLENSNHRSLDKIAPLNIGSLFNKFKARLEGEKDRDLTDRNGFNPKPGC